MVRWIVWSGLVALTLALMVLMRTRWGQSHPLRKCIVLSLIAHLLLGIYTTTVNIVTGGRGGGGSGSLRVAFIAGEGDGDANADVASDEDAEPSNSWDELGTAPVSELADRITTPGRADGSPQSTDKPTVGKPEPPPTRQRPAGRLPDEIATSGSGKQAADGRAARQLDDAGADRSAESHPLRAQASRARSRGAGANSLASGKRRPAAAISDAGDERSS